ncbi:hypothetical protein EN858_05665 [Mesorhizobium sp. M4B.F.Ca.ET.215.01.1.1]|uniref:hypothetical protein n=1 Tax=unclassified Mesorhizobium TaxID=325217 RepID=UPI000FCAE2FD|nr:MULTISPECIES: hypothetical protein [unclassified Mesorhizobium]RUW26480.1 hypothetical protein EOA34_08225 [Mesorhizobium sp. M4B.F.Ca.ET.013.02.1.1]RVD43952.1 hypothetical protein EN741_08855 [Mesorhizobium sp. M4B.F.Ca.ET.019.03.1.1]TGQ15329.1 hypothetical protein EN858_05665 [Mesorhizobium sp. M4B.F.Ca.ET.215.01.1.1]TGQ48462.1 hypothetical protein EN863_005000 [Mesorhizobium sp. M00.F.Ca.ET.220.01.1.1]TGR11394.1 hypothetical protein EN846_01740 [Mesorhizobium sp. M4B.F.Ca.ET.203.01.1.1]
MISILFRFILACLFLPWLWAAAGAQNASFPELSSAVPGHKGITYLDLANMVVPVLAGTSPIKIRPISGEADDEAPPATGDLSSAAVLDIKAGGGERLTMLFDLGQASDSAEGFAVLALYDLSGEPKLLDAVNVATDRSTFFREPARLSISAGDDAVVITSTHFNSNQGYVSTLLLMVRNDRFELVDTINTFDENYCYKRTQDLAFKTLADGRRYAAIKATVTDATVPGEDCEGEQPKASSHKISVTYRWSKKASRYVPGSKAFERLSAENEKRF